MKGLQQITLPYLLIGIFLISLPFQVAAQTYIWTGSATGGDGISWHDDDNWDRNAKPIAGAEVSIGNDSVVIYEVEDAAWVYLEDAKLTILGKLQLNNGDTFAISAVNSHILNPGELIIEESGQDDFDRAIQLLVGSSFQNDGACEILASEGGGMRLEGGSTYTNNGILSMICNKVGISLGGGVFINNDSIIITSGSSAIWLSSGVGSNFINNDFVLAKASSAVAAVRASNGGQIDNFGEFVISSTNTQNAILCSGTGSEFNHHSGSIVSMSTGAFTHVAVRSNSSFSISSGAVLDVSGSASTDLLDIEIGGTVDWNGIISVSN